MEILHRPAFTASAERQRALALLGFDVAAVGTVVLEILESDRRWEGLRQWIADERVLELSFTLFDEKEREASPWLSIVPEWQNGYPQPNERSNGYKTATYDGGSDEYCSACGMGLRQVGPFQMKAEPKWGKRNIMQLHWVVDEFFVTPELLTGAFAVHGIGGRVVTDRRRQPLSAVVQLAVDDFADIDVSGLPGSLCSNCGRTKYLPDRKGYLPPLQPPVTGHAVKTKQYFGRDALAYRLVVVSQELYRTLREFGVRGASFHPLAASGRK